MWAAPRATALLALTLTAGACSGPPTATPSPEPTTSAPPVVVTSTPDAVQQTDVRTLRYALERDPAFIEPGQTMDGEGDLVVDALFDSLTRVSEDLLTVMPAAASGWTVSEDGLTTTFDLRPGGRFHDGTPVTADDFVRAFNRITDGTRASPSFAAADLSKLVGFEASQSDGSPLDGVRSLAPLTLQIRTSSRDPALLRSLARPTMGPVPEVADDDPEAFAQRPVGNGAFQMAQPWEHNQFIRLQRMPGHRDVPGVDEIIFRIYAGSEGQAWNDLQSGLVDVVTVPPDEVEAAARLFGRGEAGLVGPGLLDAPSTTTYFYGFDVRRPPFDDARMRRAVSLTIDRERIVAELVAGTRVPLGAIVPPRIPGAQPGICDHCVYDPVAGRALVDTVLDPDGDGVRAEISPIVLSHNRGGTHGAIADLVAQDLRDELGLEVQVVSQDLQEHVASIRAGETNIFRSGWQGGSTQVSFLEPLVSGTSPDNLGGYVNPVLDELLRQAAADGETADDAALLRQAEILALDDVAVAPMHVYRHRLVVNDAVAGFRMSADGAVDLTNVRVERQP